MSEICPEANMWRDYVDVKQMATMNVVELLILISQGPKRDHFHIAMYLCSQKHSKVLVVLTLSPLISQSECSMQICLAKQKGILTGANFTSHSLFSPMAFASVNVGYAHTLQSFRLWSRQGIQPVFYCFFHIKHGMWWGIYITWCTSSHTLPATFYPVKLKTADYR